MEHGRGFIPWSRCLRCMLGQSCLARWGFCSFPFWHSFCTVCFFHAKKARGKKKKGASDDSPLKSKRAASQIVTRLFLSLRALNLPGAQATRANVDRLARALNNSLYTADVGLPGSVALTVGVGNGVTEHNALAAHTALCHGCLPPT